MMRLYHRPALAVDSSGETRLVGLYVVAKNGEEELSSKSLRRYLESVLPRYMVPATFVSLPAIPRTATGKVDASSLPLPNGDHPDPNRHVHGPRSPLEAFLAEAWSDLLSGENMDINDNFFELGGNSLQALMLMSRIRDKLGAHVATSAVLDSPTIAGLARRLRRSNPEEVNRLFGPDVMSTYLLPGNPPSAIRN